MTSRERGQGDRTCLSLVWCVNTNGLYCGWALLRMGSIEENHQNLDGSMKGKHVQYEQVYRAQKC